MNIIETGIEGLVIIEPKVFKDSRGYFYESYNKREFTDKIGDINFVQDNQSCSTKGVMRGLHFQKPPYAQAKLVRCIVGAVIDVAVDIRKDSATYGQYRAVELTEDNHRQIFIPHGFAHGFEVLSDIAVFQYKCDNYYHPESEGGITLFDPEIAISWQTPKETALLSDKDLRHPLLRDFNTPF